MLSKYASVLLVDSDSLVRRHLEEWLPPRGIELTSASTAHCASSHLQGAHFDLIILAMLLSDCDGLSVCRDLCRKQAAPVLMVSETGTPFDEVAALDAGADDFLVKPLRPEVVLARIRCLLRRSGRGRAQDLWTVGDLLIDRPGMCVSIDGRLLPLTPTELKILTQLSLAPGTPLSRDALLTAIWNSNYLADKRLVDTHVRNLRRKLSQSGSAISIYSVRGVGYKLAEEPKGVASGAMTSEGTAWSAATAQITA